MRPRAIPVLSLVIAASLAVGVAWAQQDPIGDALSKAPPPTVVTPATEAPPPPGETQIVVPPAAPAPIEPAAQPKVAAEPPPAKAIAPKAAPAKRTRYPAAVVQAIDKVTAETMRFEVRIGQPKRFKNLIFTVRSCEVSAPDELERDAMAYMEIHSQPKPVQGRPAPTAKPVFSGWLFAAAPSVNPVTHPVYDAWLIACKA